MIALTPQEIAQLKARLGDYPKALEALQEIEDCDGDVEDAAISLALRSDQEPDSNEQWLASFSKRYRHIACQGQFRQSIEAGQLSPLINHLSQNTDCPELIALPVAVYVLKSGIDTFCYSFDNSRVRD
ncbi:MAG: hypothetical protein AAF703_11350 [Cyanobacteria bacterium P01_D01_bin.105]